MEEEKEKIITEKTIDVTNITKSVQEEERKEKGKKRKLAKKQWIIIISTISLILIGTALFIYLYCCQEFKVTIKYNNGNENQVIEVRRNKTLEKLDKPKKDGYIFDNWYIEKNNKMTKETYDFDDEVTNDFTIIAKYKLNNVEVEDISILPDPINMLVGDTLELEVTITPEDASDKSVTYESSKSSIVTVDDEGLVTAIKKGTAVITATSNNGKVTQVDVTVTEDVIEVEKIDISPESKTLGVGDSASFISVVTPIDATNSKVSWSIEDRSIASVKNGIVTGLKIGETRLVATIGEIKAYADISVVAKDIVSITVKPTDKYLYNGSEVLMDADFTPEDATNKTITWSLDNTDCATISTTGKLTSKLATECPTGKNVKVIAKSSNGIEGSGFVTIEPTLQLKNDETGDNITNGSTFHTTSLNTFKISANTPVVFELENNTTCDKTKLDYKISDSKIEFTNISEYACSFKATSKSGLQTYKFSVSTLIGGSSN